MTPPLIQTIQKDLHCVFLCPLAICITLNSVQGGNHRTTGHCARHFDFECVKLKPKANNTLGNKRSKIELNIVSVHSP